MFNCYDNNKQWKKRNMSETMYICNDRDKNLHDSLGMKQWEIIERMK